jgi:hypothetical protein
VYHIRLILSDELLQTTWSHDGESYFCIGGEWYTMESISRHNNDSGIRSEILYEGFKCDLGSVDLIGVGVCEDEEFPGV